MQPDAVEDGECGRSRMGVLHVSGDRRRKRAVSGGEFGASHCNQWKLCDAALPKLLWAGLVFMILLSQCRPTCGMCTVHLWFTKVSIRGS